MLPWIERWRRLVWALYGNVNMQQEKNLNRVHEEKWLFHDEVFVYLHQIYEHNMQKEYFPIF